MVLKKGQINAWSLSTLEPCQVRATEKSSVGQSPAPYRLGLPSRSPCASFPAKAPESL